MNLLNAFQTAYAAIDMPIAPHPVFITKTAIVALSGAALILYPKNNKMAPANNPNDKNI